MSAATERVVAGDTPATTEADDERRQQIHVHPPNPRLRVSSNERSTSIGWHAERRVHPDLGWQAQELESQRAAFRRLGDLSPERIAGGSEPDLRVANQRLVRTNHSALR